MPLPDPPPWMADLPPLHHPHAKAGQLPSHATAKWSQGKPVFSTDARRARIHAVRGRCWLCGFPVEPPGYVIFTEGDNPKYGDLHTSGVGWMHASCALYASVGCPFLRYSTSRRRIYGANVYGGSAVRGRASIQGFSHYGIFWLPNPIGGPIEAVMTIGHWATTETIPLASRASTTDLYEEAVKADAAANFTSTPRSFWTDAADDRRLLEAEWAYAKQEILAARTSSVTIDGNTYRGRALDFSKAGRA